MFLVFVGDGGGSSWGRFGVVSLFVVCVGDVFSFSCVVVFACFCLSGCLGLAAFVVVIEWFSSRGRVFSFLEYFEF